MTEVHIVSSGGVGRNDNTIRGQVWKVFREKIPELGPKRGKGACHLGRMENGIPDWRAASADAWGGNQPASFGAVGASKVWQEGWGWNTPSAQEHFPFPFPPGPSWRRAFMESSSAAWTLVFQVKVNVLGHTTCLKGPSFLALPSGYRKSELSVASTGNHLSLLNKHK